MSSSNASRMKLSLLFSALFAVGLLASTAVVVESYVPRPPYSYQSVSGRLHVAPIRMFGLEPPSSRAEEQEVTAASNIARRHLMRQLFSVVVTASSFAAIPPKPVAALKPRNEQLCGTGFFTNYLEYKCTDIGDISDEGQATTLSSSQEGAADSLLNKLNLSFEEEDSPSSTSTSNVDQNESTNDKKDSKADTS
ncbi:expressed unknown protein [Seminavis robusta]|uniref:Uncharacterized protein n=1 Tax=Seminavis robusta TaxID=568900 RepID=A0A9N8EIQ0_9STRA|nr:expressed unknown protein [Seminavis robusta]|eukprot:Sro998_g229530.1 n/a (194) ;mRNA; r:27163-27744